jgi:hypothetical protein
VQSKRDDVLSLLLRVERESGGAGADVEVKSWPALSRQGTLTPGCKRPVTRATIRIHCLTETRQKSVNNP